MFKFKLTLLILILPVFLFSSNYTRMLEKKSMESRNPNLIRFKIAHFSTKEGAPSFKSLNLDGKAYKRGETGTYLVQFISSVRNEWQDEIKKMGGKLYGYIPNHAYIVRINSSKISKVQRLPFVQWVGRYKPAYRISPKLLKTVRSDIDGTIMLRIQLYKGANRYSITDQLKSLGAKILRNEKGMYYDYIRIKIPVEKTKDIATYIANMEDVNWVERFYEPVLFHAWTRWIIQSYHTSDMGSASAGWNAALSVDATHTPVYSHGIFGQGQIVGDADTGSDWDNMWMYETSGDMNFNGSGTTFSGTPGTKFVGYQTLGDDHDGASNNENSQGRGSSGHGTHTSTTIVGDSAWHDPSSDGILARGDGIAPMAKIAFQDISTTPSKTGTEGLDGLPSDLNNLFLWAYNAGARIHSDSWGSSNSNYDTYAQQSDQFMWNHKDFLAVIAMGNAGPNSGTIGSPATAKDVVSVGASQSGAGCNVAATGQESTVWQNPGDPEDRYGSGWNSDGIRDDDLETMGWFSSHGPTDEGLRKPEIVTPGGHMTYAGWSTGSTSDGPTADGHNGGYSNTSATSNGTYLCQMGGTSMATPAAAGATALIRQYYTDGFYPSGAKNSSDEFTPSAALMKATLIASTRNMTGYYTTDNGSSSSRANVPTNGQGWGRVVLDDALYFSGDSRKVEVHDVTGGLNAGQQQQYTVQTGSNTAEDFKVVLVWTDYYGTQSSSDPLVNDLNLTVSDGSNTYKGSVFGTDGYSTTGGSYDATNANEVVWIEGTNAANKTYTITVDGYDINHGPQPYALVICGDLGAATDTSHIYTRPDTVKFYYASPAKSRNKDNSNGVGIAKKVYAPTLGLKKINESNEFSGAIERYIYSKDGLRAVNAETLFYHNAAHWVFSDPDSYNDSNYTTQFTPTHDNDTLAKFMFAPYDTTGNGNGYTLRFNVYADNSGMPGTVLGYIDHPMGDFQYFDGTYYYWNTVDLSSLGLVFNTTDKFYVGIQTINTASGDAFPLIGDSLGSSICYSYEIYASNGWEKTDANAWGNYAHNFLYKAILDYATAPDTGLFFVHDSSTASGNLSVTDITVKNGASWITGVSTTSFTVTPGDSQGVNVYIDRTGLAAGTYVDTLVISNNDPAHSSYYETVYLNIGDGSGTASFTFDRDTVKIIYGGTKSNNVQRTYPVNITTPDKFVTFTSSDIRETRADGYKQQNEFVRETTLDSVYYHTIYSDGSVSYFPNTGMYEALRVTPPYYPATLESVKVWNAITGGTNYPPETVEDTIFLWYDNGGAVGALNKGLAWSFTPTDTLIYSITLAIQESYYSGDFWIGRVSTVNANGDSNLTVTDTTTADNSGRNYYSLDGGASWNQLGSGYGDWGITTYFRQGGTDSAAFYIINSKKSTANLEVTDVYAKNGSSWILDVTMPQKGAAPGESIPVYINVDTLNLDTLPNIYYDSIVVVSNGIGSKGRADAYMPILLDYNTGLHSGISLVADKKAIKKLNLITKKNPFTDNTAIEFALPNKAKVTLSIYDISGKKVNTLVDREYNSGRYTMKWNGEDSNGKKLPGGFYFARIKAGNKSMITKIVKLR